MDNLGIGDLAAIIAAAGVTIYVLGLIGLAIPISRTFTEDLTTAWYAVSLLPRTVVAGQGVRIWFRWPLLITTVLLLLSPTTGPGATGVGIDSALPEGDKVVTFSQIRAVFPLQVMVGSLLVLGFGFYALAQVLRAVYERKRGWMGLTISWILAAGGAGVANLVFLQESFRIIYPLSPISLLQAS